MKTSACLSLAAFASLVIVGLWAGNAFSQGGAPASNTAPDVAAIDLSKILKDHKRFNAMMEQMKKEVTEAESGLNKQRESIANLEKEIQARYKPGTPEFKKAEEELFKQKNNFNYQASLMKKDLLEKETQIYYSINKEIVTEVEAFAKKYGIVMVLRYNSDTSDGTNRSELAKELGKAIIYIRPDLDITPYIVKSLNEKPGRPVGPTAGTNIPGRPGGAAPLK